MRAWCGWLQFERQFFNNPSKLKSSAATGQPRSSAPFDSYSMGSLSYPLLNPFFERDGYKPVDVSCQNAGKTGFNPYSTWAGGRDNVFVDGPVVAHTRARTVAAVKRSW